MPCVPKSPPVLDYQTPQKSRVRSPWPIRVIAGLVAGLITLMAAVFIVGGLFDVVEGKGWGHFLAGLSLVALAHLLWKPVGLRLWRRIPS